MFKEEDGYEHRSLTKHRKCPHQPNGKLKWTLPAVWAPQKDVTYQGHKVPVDVNVLSTELNWLHNRSEFRCWERISKEELSPKSKFSLILTIKAPVTLSSASGFSLRGFHLSVPGILPYTTSTTTSTT